MQDNYGFSPANAQWEAYAQGRQGATMVLKVADGTDFGVLADNLRTIGYHKPKKDDGVWRGGADLVAGIDPTLTPEVQYVVLLEDQGLVVTSDSAAYAAQAAAVAKGDGKNLASSGKVDGLDDTLGRPANAMLWSGDFACEDLAMSKADQDSQTQADDLVQRAGGVTPLSGLAMAMSAYADPAGGRGVRDVGGGPPQPPSAGEAGRRRRRGPGRRLLRQLPADGVADVGLDRRARPAAPGEERVRALRAVRRAADLRDVLRAVCRVRPSSEHANVTSGASEPVHRCP